MAAALGGLGLLQGRVRLAAAAAATSSLGRPGRRAPVRGDAAAALPSAGRSYGSEAKEEEELRVRYLDDEHKGNEGRAAAGRPFPAAPAPAVSGPSGRGDPCAPPRYCGAAATAG